MSTVKLFNLTDCMCVVLSFSVPLSEQVFRTAIQQSLNKTDLIKNNCCLCSAGRQLLLKAVNRVWTELMHSKRQMLEDIFKVSLPCNDRGHVDIATARPALEEPALKSWQNHLGEGHWATHTHRQAVL